MFDQVTVGFAALPREDGSNVYKSDFKEKSITINVTAMPDTHVGLLAVDEAVFALLKYHRLTQKKVKFCFAPNVWMGVKRINLRF